MMKQFIKVLLVVLIAAAVGITSVAAGGAGYIALNGVKLGKLATAYVEGYVNISGSTTEEKLRLVVTGADKQTWYEVKVSAGQFTEEIWFDSPGEYSVRVMVNEYGRKYSQGPGITVRNTKELDKYLIPAKHIESNEVEISDKALAITENCSSDLEKIRTIYDWIINNIEYDYEKLSKQDKGQYDNQYGAVNTLNTGKGVCYDYATLLAALARSLGIKAKVAEGELSSGTLKGLHAWNEVYIQELDGWINIDATMAAATGENYFDFADNGESYVAYKYR